MKLSICIVNFNAKDYLRKCLESIYANSPKEEFEVVLVDNASSDGSQELIEKKFRQVKCIKNPENLGFAKANNQALKISTGEYLFTLNNDTIILDNALDVLVKFMDNHPEAGACGPNILNADGTIQHQCKRGFPTPWNILSHFLKLDKLFPKNRLFGGYLLTYINPNKIREVDSLSGAAILVRKKVINEVGYMDASYFLYADDIDWCYRIKKAGWKIYFVPAAQIIHFGGRGGTAKRPYRNIYYFYRSAFMFYRRYLAKNYLFLINWLVYFGILMKFIITFILNITRREKIIGSKKPS